MAESVDNLQSDLGRLAGRKEPSAAAQVRRQLRGKHVCPFCGTTREADVGPCSHCSLEDTPTTRAATRGKLGPWYVLQSRNPSAPGMNFATLMMLVQKGRVTARSVVRGPTTGQFWRHSAKVKGISREFGLCWNCGGDLLHQARVCPSCKRMQEAPLNPDQLLEQGEMSAEELTEQMWAADAPSSQAGAPSGNRPATGSPVDRLTSKGGIRREVDPRDEDEFESLDDAGDSRGAGSADGPKGQSGNKYGRNKRNGNGKKNGGRSRHNGSALPEPARDSMALPTLDFSVSIESDDRSDDESAGRRHSLKGMLAEAADELPNHLEMAVFQRPYDGQGSGRGAGRKFFKALLIALILAGIGLGTMCYLDETIRAKTIGYWEQARKWVASLANNVRPVSHSKPAVAIEPIADRSTAVDRPGASELPPASRLLEAGNEAQRKGNWAQAIRQWEQLKSSGVKDEELPLGLDARIVAAKKKLQETGK